MPGGDRTGPYGNGGIGRGFGRMGGPLAAGPGGNCVCPKCGTVVGHVVGQPCNQITCSKCGSLMIRK